MKLSFVLCFLLGSIVVFQPSLNRVIFEHKGLSFAVLLNGAILFVIAAIFFLAISLSPERFPDIFRFLPNRGFSWWYILPGIMGFLLVLLVPVMIKNLGAFPVVITMILGQVTTSFLWDIYQEGVSLSAARLLGLILVMTGAYFSFKPIV